MKTINYTIIPLIPLRRDHVPQLELVDLELLHEHLKLDMKSVELANVLRT